MNTKLMFSSKEEKWATPQSFFDALNEEFHFTLDPAASDDNAKCEKYYTKEQNGLTQSWQGETVFCNPPYGRNVGEWVKKAHDEHAKGDCTIVMLLFARTDTKWFHEYVLGKAEVQFVRGRLKFGDEKNPAPTPSIVVIYRRRKDGTVD